jgi:hypothetical protein
MNARKFLTHLTTLAIFSNGIVANGATLQEINAAADRESRRVKMDLDIAEKKRKEAAEQATREMQAELLKRHAEVSSRTLSEEEKIQKNRDLLNSPALNELWGEHDIVNRAIKTAKKPAVRRDVAEMEFKQHLLRNGKNNFQGNSNDPLFAPAASETSLYGPGVLSPLPKNEGEATPEDQPIVNPIEPVIKKTQPAFVKRSGALTPEDFPLPTNKEDENQPLELPIHHEEEPKDLPADSPDLVFHDAESSIAFAPLKNNAQQTKVNFEMPDELLVKIPELSEAEKRQAEERQINAKALDFMNMVFAQMQKLDILLDTKLNPNLAEEDVQKFVDGFGERGLGFLRALLRKENDESLNVWIREVGVYKHDYNNLLDVLKLMSGANDVKGFEDFELNSKSIQTVLNNTSPDDLKMISKLLVSFQGNQTQKHIIKVDDNIQVIETALVQDLSNSLKNKNSEIWTWVEEMKVHKKTFMYPFLVLNLMAGSKTIGGFENFEPSKESIKSVMDKLSPRDCAAIKQFGLAINDLSTNYFMETTDQVLIALKGEKKSNHWPTTVVSPEKAASENDKVPFKYIPDEPTIVLNASVKKTSLAEPPKDLGTTKAKRNRSSKVAKNSR